MAAIRKILISDLKKAVSRLCHTSTPNQASTKKASFGLLFDIDGVIVRGREVLPPSRTAFGKLVDGNGKFKVPTVFLTNGGNVMRHQKAKQLSDWLDLEVSEEQVVMSHSPLKMFKEYHDKHCLISGQGPIEEIAKAIGFTHVTTVDQLREKNPILDAVDHKRRTDIPFSVDKNFPVFEAIVLFGEPVRWETSLQLILDVLMTNGGLSAISSVPHFQIPILACNMDLQWMAEAPFPRLGHGAFMVCLENLYKKVTGHDMKYRALVGKPSEITFHHAEQCISEHAQLLGMTPSIERLYMIGDNINTDIYGANLYNQYLQRRKTMPPKVMMAAGSRVQMIQTQDELISYGANTCESILVLTGVYNQKTYGDHEHSPRDFLPVESKLKSPSHCVNDVLAAVDLVLSKEKVL